MASKERICEFINERKRPVEAAVVAHHFLIGIPAATTHLKRLYEEGKVTKERKSKHVYWGRIETPVAVPESPLVSRIPALPIQNSYPHIRGYDD